MNINNANNILIDQNVFYQARVFHVRALGMKNFTFTNNLMIGVTVRPTTVNVKELIACFATFNRI
jgi:hypothetical protein